MDKIFEWGHSRRYNDYPTYIKNKFGGRVQKISVNVGFSCPNRDGTKGTGGCIYCDNITFKPGYCEPGKTVTDQLNRGVDFFSKKYPDMKFMAYFQSYTNTYAPVENLKKLYYEAISVPNIVSLVIGTRPDCISKELLEMLAEINRNIPVTIEFGLESTNDKTLKEINRCHTWNDSLNAIKMCADVGIDTCGHIILGLPGESDSDMLTHAKIISELPLTSIKLHQLQIIKNTKLANIFASNPNYVKLFSLDDYLVFIIRFLELLNPKIIIERFVSVSPIEKLIAPKWNRMKNFEIVAKIEKALINNDTWQGKYFQSKT
ncbi:MAG: TIGR01212 family radical SAM protein [Salinivirgaceae bacterium]|nr:TIGR01212 family radical SAM protein [Salinivirgaceae bacterium]